MASLHFSEDIYPDSAAFLRSIYEGVLQSIDLKAALTLDFGAARLALAVRKAADRSVDGRAAGKAAERWLEAHIGPVDDALRRAAVAALALGLKPDTDALPLSLLALYPTMHARLTRFLTGAHSYDEGRFANDIALSVGAYALLGPLTIAVPSPVAPRISLPRVKRAAAMVRRQLDQGGVGEALSWLGAWRSQPWVELHVDTRDLGEFNEAGFLRGYHRLADLMALRPDLAGVYGASWLYQPELAKVSPNLAFARETAEAGGGRVVRLRADPMQTTFAIARSPTRKRLFLCGDYKPVCYGMFWERQALMNWSRSQRRAEANLAPPHPKTWAGADDKHP